MAPADAVLLIAFGGPTRPEEIRPFLENVTRGRRIPPERLEEVAHHYELIGGRSPLNELTVRQAEALRRTLQAKTPNVFVNAFTRQSAKHAMKMAGREAGDLRQRVQR